jgi:hypothetical protein
MTPQRVEMRSARELGPIGRDPELDPTVTVSEGEFHDFVVGEVEVLEGVAYDVVVAPRRRVSGTATWPGLEPTGDAWVDLG